jgi:hypothetical protein
MNAFEESDSAAQQREKAAAAAVCERLLGAVGRVGDMRFVDVVENASHPMTYCYTGGDVRGTLVTARIWVADDDLTAHMYRACGVPQ